MAGTTAWQIDGLIFALPDEQITSGIARMCEKGWYEGEERRALAAQLQEGDRFLEIGGGGGLVACVAARMLGADAVTTVEANPVMCEVARRNLERNGFAESQVRLGAVVPGRATYGETITLYIPDAFWAASTRFDPGVGGVPTPKLGLEDLLDEARPNVLCLDIEGAEEDFFLSPCPSDLRVIILELHPARYGRAGIATIFGRMADQGYAYDPAGSAGAVVCFSRL